MIQNPNYPPGVTEAQVCGIRSPVRERVDFDSEAFADDPWTLLIRDVLEQKNAEIKAGLAVGKLLTERK